MDKSRRLTLRFLASPVELIGGDAGLVKKMRLVRNELCEREDGNVRPQPTNKFEEVKVGLVFRSVGYRGVPLPGVPFHEKRGVILNERGRVMDPDTNRPVVGEYTAGWIKRGPSGIIGTNKPDALETVNCMVEDFKEGTILEPSLAPPSAAEEMIKRVKPDFFSYEDWLRLDGLEVARGKEQGRPRLKFTCVEDMQAALGR